MVTRFSNHVLDQYLAPNVSKFHCAEIPDMSSEKRSWLPNFFLNSILRGSFTDPQRQYILNFLRRVEAAHVAHELARSATLEFLTGSRQSVSCYMRAILHWESFLAQSWMGYQLIRTPSGKKVFEPGDGSVLQRLHCLYNRSKHSENAIQAGQLAPGGTITVWMEDHGLQGHEVALSWQESGDVLEDLSSGANALEDPITAVEKLEALR